MANLPSSVLLSQSDMRSFLSAVKTYVDEQISSITPPSDIPAEPEPDKIGDLSELNTENKTLLVDAINEVLAIAQSGSSAPSAFSVVNEQEYKDGEKSHDHLYVIL